MSFHVTVLFTAVRSLLMFYVEYFAVISAMFSAKLALPAECKAGWELVVFILFSELSSALVARCPSL
jgi:hypothetical protein